MAESKNDTERVTKDKTFGEAVATVDPPLDRHPEQLATIPNLQYVLQQVQEKQRKQDECEKLRLAGADCANVPPPTPPVKDFEAAKKRNAERKKLLAEVQKGLKEYGQESDIPTNHIYWTNLGALRALGPEEPEK